MKEEFTPRSRKENLVVQELDGEVLIYDLQTNKAFCLNITSALVWQACDGTKNIAAISKWVSEKLDSANNEDLVWLALDQLKKERLIENGAEINSHFEGLSRRQVIKKIGLGSMIAIPVVSSLVAPVAAATGSGACAGNLGLACLCPYNPCNTGDSNPAPATTCNGTPDCSNGPAANNCDCVGPFVCSGINNFKTGMCGVN